MSVALHDPPPEVTALVIEPDAELDLNAGELRSRRDEVILLEIADDDLADRTGTRTAFGGLLVSLLLHVWLMPAPVEALEPV
ncbi:MAG: hypothetical protein FD138_2008 [Planctomycetota bacterium]|nr:MAG: hypothetical protein FD138_2008 [Planctomycetota bacterium]